MKTCIRRSLLFVLLVGSNLTSAQPSVGLIWTATSGTGITGSDTIRAAPGDYLTLDIVVNDNDGAGIDAVLLDRVSWDDGDLTVYDPVVCPQPPNLSPGSCYDAISSQFLSEFGPGVVAYSYYLQNFYVERSGTTAFFGPGNPMTLGRMSFQVESSATNEKIDIGWYFGRILDGNGDVWAPPATATILPPLPSCSGCGCPAN